MSQINIEGLSYYYPNKEKPAIDNIDCKISSGEFILLLGESGSGKSTLGKLIANLAPEFYGGKIKGKVEVDGSVGIVFQDPEKQMVMDTVKREIAFGLENLGIESKEIKRRIMEAISFLNISKLEDKKTYELSGGEQQKVAIASVVAMASDIIVFDEPTSQLDPSAAEEIFQMIKRLNESLGYTIILIEQHIDKCFKMADRVLLMEDGKLKVDILANEFIKKYGNRFYNFIPTIGRFFEKLDISGDIPINVKAGQNYLRTNELVIDNKKIKTNLVSEVNPIIEMDNISYSYKKGKRVLNDIKLSVNSKDFLAIAGSNGSGKTTLLKVLTKLYKPDNGKVSIKGRIGFLSQNPNDYLFNESVYEELLFSLKNQKIEETDYIDEILIKLGIHKYKETNPRDLSGGERQRVALASVLVTKPDILVLDEPTRGLDNLLKDKLGEILLKLQKSGKTIILVTHDIEFIGKYAEKVSLIFNGEIIANGYKEDILSTGLYYTTQISRLFRKINPKILNIKDGLKHVTKVDNRMLEAKQ